MAAVALTPSRPGIRMSMRTTSGRSRRMTARAASPSPAVPTTVISGSEASRRGETGAYELLVVDDHDGDHRGRSEPTGRLAVTRNPPSR